VTSNSKSTPKSGRDSETGESGSDDPSLFVLELVERCKVHCSIIIYLICLINRKALYYLVKTIMAHKVIDQDGCRYLDRLTVFRKQANESDDPLPEQVVFLQKLLRRCRSANDDCIRRRWTPIVLEEILMMFKQVVKTDQDPYRMCSDKPT
jgi:hypothetical protein